MQLAIVPADVKALCSIPAGDVSQDADIAALLLAQQPPAEYALDPSILAAAVRLAAPIAPATVGLPEAPGLLSALTLGVSERLAGSFLIGLARRPVYADAPGLTLLGLAPPAGGDVPAVPVALVRRLCGREDSDTSDDAAIELLIGAELAARAWALDPAVLAAATLNAGLLAVILLGLSECLAASFLSQQARALGFTDDLHVGGLDLTASKSDGQPDQSRHLLAQGEARLAPFKRLSRTQLFALTNPDQMVLRGERLAAEGLKRLEPYLRSARRVALDAINAPSVVPGVADGSAKVVEAVTGAVTGSVFANPERGAAFVNPAFVATSSLLWEGDEDGR